MTFQNAVFQALRAFRGAFTAVGLLPDTDTHTGAPPRAGESGQRGNPLFGVLVSNDSDSGRHNS